MTRDPDVQESGKLCRGARSGLIGTALGVPARTARRSENRSMTGSRLSARATAGGATAQLPAGFCKCQTAGLAPSRAAP